MLLAATISVGSRARAQEPITPTFRGLSMRETAEETYAVNALTIVHLGNSDASSWRAVEGLKYRLPLERDVFFRIMGRNDLSDQYLSRQRTARVLGIVGDVVGVSGFLLLFDSNHSRAWFVVPAAMCVGGIVLIEVGDGLKKPTFPEAPAQEMVTQYNRALRQKLGLPPDPDDENGPRPAAPRLSFRGAMPFLGAGAAGVTSSWTF